jgi:hypothetical protein
MSVNGSEPAVVPAVTTRAVGACDCERTDDEALGQLGADVLDRLIDLSLALKQGHPELLTGGTDGVVASLCTLFDLCHHLADDDVHRACGARDSCSHCKDGER